MTCCCLRGERCGACSPGYVNPKFQYYKIASHICKNCRVAIFCLKDCDSNNCLLNKLKQCELCIIKRIHQEKRKTCKGFKKPIVDDLQLENILKPFLPKDILKLIAKYMICCKSHCGCIVYKPYRKNISDSYCKGCVGNEHMNLNLGHCRHSNQKCKFAN